MGGGQSRRREERERERGGGENGSPPDKKCMVFEANLQVPVMTCVVISTSQGQSPRLPPRVTLASLGPAFRVNSWQNQMSPISSMCRTRNVYSDKSWSKNKADSFYTTYWGELLPEWLSFKEQSLLLCGKIQWT